MSKAGRPSTFNQETADMICERLAEGESLRTICADDAMPSKATVFKWLGQQPQFADQYARAREEQAETLADEIIDLADTCRKGVKTTTKANGDVETVEIDMIDRARLQVEARKWVAAKLKPKKYGDKVHQEITGADGEPLLKGIEVTFVAGKQG